MGIEHDWHLEHVGIFHSDAEAERLMAESDRRTAQLLVATALAQEQQAQEEEARRLAALETPEG